MNTINKFYSALLPFFALGSLLVAAPPAAGQEIQVSYGDGQVHLGVGGRFYEFRVERAVSPEGPYEFLGWRYIGCTEACEWIDSGIEEGSTYWYRFDLLDADWRLVRLGPTAVTTPSLVGRILASAAFPSPFTETTTIGFRIPNLLAQEDGIDTQVTILDATGRTIRSLHSGIAMRGANILEWDGRDADGHPAASGSYWYLVQVGEVREAGRIVKLP